jgi:hypothetical protein
MHLDEKLHHEYHIQADPKTRDPPPITNIGGPKSEKGTEDIQNDTGIVQPSLRQLHDTLPLPDRTGLLQDRSVYTHNYVITQNRNNEATRDLLPDTGRKRLNGKRVALYVSTRTLLKLHGIQND